MSEEPDSFLESPLGDRDLDRALVHFHTTVRPRLGRCFRGVRWTDLADLASEVELKLILRLRSEIDKSKVASTWQTECPAFGGLVGKSMQAGEVPRLTARRVLASSLQEPSFYAVFARGKAIEEDGAGTARFYLRHTQLKDRRDHRLDPAMFVRSCLTAGISTVEHARLAMRCEVAPSRSSLHAKPPTSFHDVRSWEAFCLSVARTTYLDILRRRKRHPLVSLDAIENEWQRESQARTDDDADAR